MHNYTNLAAPVQTTVGDSQCKTLAASAQLAIFLSQNLIFDTSIMLLWKQSYFKLLIFYVRHLDRFCSTQWLHRGSGDVSPDSSITGMECLGAQAGPIPPVAPEASSAEEMRNSHSLLCAAITWTNQPIDIPLARHFLSILGHR